MFTYRSPISVTSPCCPAPFDDVIGGGTAPLLTAPPHPLWDGWQRKALPGHRSQCRGHGGKVQRFPPSPLLPPGSQRAKGWSKVLRGSGEVTTGVKGHQEVKQRSEVRLKSEGSAGKFRRSSEVIVMGQPEDKGYQRSPPKVSLRSKVNWKVQSSEVTGRNQRS